ncbi:MAG: hypothetical protein KDJ54_08840 [Candidatus Competibacteraceae bacterium]|nr:hypothetical protein [Candidatus Competibacteraceae bacterium]
MPTIFETDISRVGVLAWNHDSWDACNDEPTVQICFFVPTNDNPGRVNVLGLLEQLAGSSRLPWLIRHSGRWLLNLTQMSKELFGSNRYGALKFKGTAFVTPLVRTKQLSSSAPLGDQYKYIETAEFFLDDKILESAMAVHPPIEISNSLARFRADYPDPTKVGFVIMQFGTTKAHERILSAIRDTLAAKNLVAVRADDTQYHDDLFYNILTYIHGSSFAVSVFERLETEQFNPNVSLEVGYMLALGKPVCLIKDRTLKVLPTDIVGRLYKSFDPQDPVTTIEPELTAWLRDKKLA